MSNESAVIAPLWGEKHTFQEISHFLPAASQLCVPVVIVPDRRASYHVYAAKGARKKPEGITKMWV